MAWAKSGELRQQLIDFLRQSIVLPGGNTNTVFYIFDAIESYAERNHTPEMMTLSETSRRVRNTLLELLFQGSEFAAIFAPISDHPSNAMIDHNPLKPVHVALLDKLPSILKGMRISLHRENPLLAASIEQVEEKYRAIFETPKSPGLH